MNHRSRAWLRLLSLILCFLAAASPQADESPPALDMSPAPLIYNNRQLTVFRAPFLGLTPKERVEVSSRRIARLLEKHRGEPITATKEAEGMVLWVGDSPLFPITPGDVDTLTKQTMEAAAAEALRQLSDPKPSSWYEQARLWLASAKPWLTLTALVVLTLLGLRWASQRLFRITCPACQNSNRAQVAVSRRWSKSAWFKLKSKYHCRACGHEWGDSGRRSRVRHGRALKS